jgi:hypothetical protein
VSYLVMLGYITFALAALPPPQQLLQLFVLSRAALGAGGVLIVAGALSVAALFFAFLKAGFVACCCICSCSAGRHWVLAVCWLWQVRVAAEAAQFASCCTLVLLWLLQVR